LRMVHVLVGVFLLLFFGLFFFLITVTNTWKKTIYGRKDLFCLTVSEVSVHHCREGVARQSNSHHSSQEVRGERERREKRECLLNGVSPNSGTVCPLVILSENTLTDTPTSVCY
jgi:hypothetical protein